MILNSPIKRYVIKNKCSAVVKSFQIMVKYVQCIKKNKGCL